MIDTDEAQALYKNLLYSYTQFAQRWNVAPNAWLMHPRTWDRLRTSLAPLMFTWDRERPGPAVSAFGDPPTLLRCPVLCTPDLPEDTIRAACI